MENVYINIETKKLVKAEVYHSGKGIKLFIAGDEAGGYIVSEYFSGRYFAKGGTPETAKKNAEKELWERKILTQDDMEIYINERCFKSINE